jgi:phospholipid transport system transporter-binding protein
MRRSRPATPVEVREVSAGHIALEGPLEYETARHAHEKGLALIAASDVRMFQVDCAGVSRCDSAALAVLIDWMAEARKRQMRLCVVNVPDDLRAIARISEVDQLLEQGVDCGAPDA